MSLLKARTIGLLMKFNIREDKLKTVNEVIEAYRDGNAEERMYLFLDYRDLRDAFIDIDCCETEPETQAHVKEKKMNRPGREKQPQCLHFALRYCRVLFSKL